MTEKDFFLTMVHDIIMVHPEWTNETYQVIQGAILDRLNQSESDKSQLAYALSWMWEKTPDNRRQKYIELFSGGLEVLNRFMAGSAFGRDLDAWLKEHNDPR